RYSSVTGVQTCALPISVTVSHPSGVVVLLGNGDGTFTPAPGSPIPVGFFATGIVAADFNNDGKADLAVSDGIGNIVSILLGNGRSEERRVGKEVSYQCE